MYGGDCDTLKKYPSFPAPPRPSPHTMHARQTFVANVVLESKEDENDTLRVEEHVIKSTTPDEIRQRSIEYFRMYLAPFDASTTKRHMSKYPEHLPQMQAIRMTSLFKSLEDPEHPDSKTKLLMLLRECRQQVLQAVTSPTHKAFLGDLKKMGDPNLRMYSVFNKDMKDIQTEMSVFQAGFKVRKSKIAVTAEVDDAAPLTKKQQEELAQKEKERDEMLQEMLANIAKDARRPVERAIMVGSICDVLGRTDTDTVSFAVDVGELKPECSVQPHGVEDVLATLVEDVTMENDTREGRAQLKEIADKMENTFGTFKLPLRWTDNQIDLNVGTDGRRLLVPLPVLRNLVINEAAQVMLGDDDYEPKNVQDAVVSTIPMVDKLCTLFANVGVMGPMGTRGVVLEFFDEGTFTRVNDIVMEFGESGRPQPIIMLRTGQIKKKLLEARAAAKAAATGAGSDMEDEDEGEGEKETTVSPLLEKYILSYPSFSTSQSAINAALHGSKPRAKNRSGEKNVRRKKTPPRVHRHAGVPVHPHVEVEDEDETLA